MSRRKVHEGKLDAFFTVLTEELKDARPRSEESCFAVERLVQRSRKRARYIRGRLAEEARLNFIETNSSVGAHVLSLGADDVANAKHFITVVLERYTRRHVPELIQETLDIPTLVDFWRFGPGSSNGVSWPDGTPMTHTVDKLNQPMSCTAACEPLVKSLRRCNLYLSAHDGQTGGGTSVVSGSRLSTVPKNEDTVRTIAIEPSGNMALQLAAGVYLEGALRAIGLDIRHQQFKNKLMAQQGSIDGSFATIDLKSASDMISIALVRELVPDIWFQLLMTIRSPRIRIKQLDLDMDLNMISTMGNGFTFPLMTLIIISLIYAVRCRVPSSPYLYMDWGKTCVFGDDIIIPTHEYDDVCEVLVRAGLLVNHEKSYRSGLFRESCGGDYYRGVDVTPFYVKHLYDDRAVYVAINQCLEWSAKTGVLLQRSIRLLMTFLVGKARLIPEWHGPDEGILTSRCPKNYKYLKTIVPRFEFRGNPIFEMMLVAGGYLESGYSGKLFYAPRPFKTKARVRHKSLPKGWLAGADPLTRSASVSDFIAQYIPFLLP